MKPPRFLLRCVLTDDAVIYKPVSTLAYLYTIVDSQRSLKSFSISNNIPMFEQTILVKPKAAPQILRGLADEYSLHDDAKTLSHFSRLGIY